jgi:isoleucyl-tRNA synthetase
MSNQPEKKPESIGKSPLVLREEEILAFWNKERVFEQSIEKPAGLTEPRGDFVFYDGPPFATGLPHYGHILAGTIKDAIPRYKTMRGYRVRRRWGWDCHGLPVENIIEKELGLKTKKDIVAYGIEKFNEASRASVMRYADEWRKLVPRFGRFVDMDDDYRTMDSTYTESVWWAFKKLHDKKLIYEGFKVMQFCPRCETSLSNFEVAQGYKDIPDLSAYVKFELVDSTANSANSGKTHILAWTTTPWTLPGNVALAVGADIDYVKAQVKTSPESTENQPFENYIFAKSLLEKVKAISKLDFTIVAEMKGSELVGKSYKPPFEYYTSDTTIKNRANGWKMYPADFVTTEDGTGVVHIAPAFGADDYALSVKYNLPFIQHVTVSGVFKKEVTDFAGQSVKPKSEAGEKDAHQRADIEIIKNLAHRGLLFGKEKITHSYPHCWRCDTPLLNYATSSWFVKVPEFKDKLVAANKKVAWVPHEVGQGRFGNWLEGARDWAISRSRFWGAPLPVWKDEKTGEVEVIGSIADLKSRIANSTTHSKKPATKNTYFVMRHGEAENNVKHITSSIATTPHHLTEKGRAQAQATADKLLADGTHFDFIITSPFVRTKETAAIVAKTLKMAPEQTREDARIAEVDTGTYNGKSVTDYHTIFEGADRFMKKPEGGENFTDVKRRVGDFIYDIDSTYSNKKILIVTHDTPSWLLFAAATGLDESQANALRGTTRFFIENAQIRPLDFTPLPHNPDYTLDLHRPYIDEIELTSKAGNKLVRVPEVFDCWFESGSMPFAEAHYPFETDEFAPVTGTFSRLFKKSKGFPAQFIAEGVDQTRGWFYSMLVLGVALFDKSPFENVIVNGTILAEDGEKMSKSKKNYPDPMVVVDKYGADAVRYYMLSSPVVHAQDFCFSEKGVDEVVKKHIGRLNNVISFFEMYADKKGTGESLAETKNSHSQTMSTHVLDQWILQRLSQLTNEVTHSMESYELDKATRPFADFIDDLSTWYIRRSRDRFKADHNPAAQADKKAALDTTRYVLATVAKLLAPFMPFFAEDIFGRVKYAHDPISVHLCAWPTLPRELDVKASTATNIIELMAEVRRISSLGLEARSKAKINVRQPLQTLMVKQTSVSNTLSKIPELVALITDEVNVKSVEWKSSLIDASGVEKGVELDTTITESLKEEGAVRDLIRAIQDLRKKTNLTIADIISLEIFTDMNGKSIIEKNSTELKKITGVSDITFVSSVAVSAETISIGGMTFAISIKK